MKKLLLSILLVAALSATVSAQEHLTGQNHLMKPERTDRTKVNYYDDANTLIGYKQQDMGLKDRINIYTGQGRKVAYETADTRDELRINVFNLSGRRIGYRRFNYSKTRQDVFDGRNKKVGTYERTPHDDEWRYTPVAEKK